MFTEQYFIQINLSDDTPIQLNVFTDKSEAINMYELYKKDRELLTTSYMGLQNIPISDITSISLNVYNPYCRCLYRTSYSTN